MQQMIMVEYGKYYAETMTQNTPRKAEDVTESTSLRKEL